MIIPTFGLNTLHTAHRTPLRGLCVCALFVADAQAEHPAHVWCLQDVQPRRQATARDKWNSARE